MKTTRSLLLGAVSLLGVACGPAVSGGDGGDGEGGANANDRSSGGEVGAVFGAAGPELVVSPSGRFVVTASRRTPTIHDLETETSIELSFLADRVVFSRTREVAYVVKSRLSGVVAIDLATGAELWSSTPALSTSAGSFLAKVTADDRALLLGDYDRVLVLDAQTGEVRGARKVGAMPVDVEILPDQRHAVAVGSTRWDAVGPHTPVSLFDFEGRVSVTIDVPNCAAPIVVLPGGDRALLSPTFCEAGKGPTAGSPPDAPPPPRDPVSVIDIDVTAVGGALRFVKNLPGFGPVALLPDARAVAYVDRDRVEAPMFDDPSQIPPKDGPKHYLMVIEPRSMRFDLHPIGEALPRFAASRDGRALLVDATVSLAREGEVKVTFGPSGVRAEASAGVFGQQALFGTFDLDTRRYAPFAGPAVSLDRFVQQEGGRVFALNATTGGGLFAIDLAARTSEDLGRKAHDVGLLPDGRTLVLWTSDGLCLSQDGASCTKTIATR